MEQKLLLGFLGAGADLVLAANGAAGFAIVRHVRNALAGTVPLVLKLVLAFAVDDLRHFTTLASYGCQGRDRTCDFLFNRQALLPLSYLATNFSWS